MPPPFRLVPTRALHLLWFMLCVHCITLLMIGFIWIDVGVAILRDSFWDSLHCFILAVAYSTFTLRRWFRHNGRHFFFQDTRNGINEIHCTRWNETNAAYLAERRIIFAGLFLMMLWWCMAFHTIVNQTYLPFWPPSRVKRKRRGGWEANQTAEKEQIVKKK